MASNLMKAIVTTGNGGYEKLVYKDVAIPEIMQGEVLIKVRKSKGWASFNFLYTSLYHFSGSVLTI